MADDPIEQAPPSRFEDYCGRFSDLAKEAYRDGIDSVVVLRELAHFEHTEEKRVGFQGGPVLAIGMCEWAKRKLHDQMYEEED